MLSQIAKNPPKHHVRCAMTIVELLVVINIVAVILALLLAAVQASRESARRVQCESQLRQIALGFSAHEAAHGHLPTGGWGWQWHGDPDRGFGPRQPGGWPYNVLPFVDQEALRERGTGTDGAVKRAELRAVAETPVPLFICPSRRAAIAYPFVHPVPFVNTDWPSVVARGDYAANAGDQYPGLYGPGPASLAQGDSPFYPWSTVQHSGICFQRSTVRTAHVLDGASHTYLVAEGYLHADHYTTGTATNDDQCLHVGNDRDTLRVTNPAFPPLWDTARIDSDHSFGSAHLSGFNAAFCDGSARFVSFQIAPETHAWLGNRTDGESLPDNF